MKNSYLKQQEKNEKKIEQLQKQLELEEKRKNTKQLRIKHLKNEVVNRFYFDLKDGKNIYNTEYQNIIFDELIQQFFKDKSEIDFARTILEEQKMQLSQKAEKLLKIEKEKEWELLPQEEKNKRIRQREIEIMRQYEQQEQTEQHTKKDLFVTIFIVIGIIIGTAPFFLLFEGIIKFKTFLIVYGIIIILWILFKIIFTYCMTGQFTTQKEDDKPIKTGWATIFTILNGLFKK